MKSTAERLLWLREKVAKIERPDLEDIAEIYKGHIWLIEHGKRKDLGSSTASKLAVALGCSERWLTSGDGEPPTKDEVTAAVECARQRAAIREQARHEKPSTGTDS